MDAAEQPSQFPTQAGQRRSSSRQPRPTAPENAPTIPGTVRRLPTRPITTTTDDDAIRGGGATAVVQGTLRLTCKETLGQGGMGVVRRAVDGELQRELAIKMLLHETSSTATARFIDEGQITGQLEHPNIVPVHALGRDAHGRPWLAMKLVHGKTLAQLIAQDRQKPLTPERLAEWLNMFMKIADAMAFAHSRHIIHRDLKPDNVMVGEFGEVLVMDWGLAKPIHTETADGAEARGTRRAMGPASPSPSPSSSSSSSSSSSDRHVRTSRRQLPSEPVLTVDGDVLGTPAFMPPEQARGEIEMLDERADVFALGAILYAILTGSAPYEGTNVVAVLAKAVRRDLVPPTERTPQRRIPRELSAIAMRAMAAKPAERYRTVQAMQADLQAWVAFRPTRAYRPSLGERIAKWVRRHPVRAMATALSVIFAAVVAAIVAITAQQVSAAKAVAVQEEHRRLQIEKEAAESTQQAARNREEMLRVLAQNHDWEALAREMGAQAVHQRDAAVIEYERLLEAATKAGIRPSDFLDSLPREQLIRFRDAANRLIESHKLTPKLVRITANDYYLRAMLRNYLDKDSAGAMADYDECLRLKPDFHEGYLNRGVIKRNLGDLPGAMADYDRALALKPDFSDALSNRGVAKSDINDNTGAMADFDRCIEVDPQLAEAYSNRGMLKAKLADFAGAIADYDHALKLKPNLAEAHNNRGVANISLGQFRAAVADFDRAIELRPDLPDAFNGRGVAKNNLRDYPGAIEDHSRAIALNPKHSVAFFNRGIAQIELGETAAGVADFDRALELSPQLWQAWYRRALATQHTDRRVTEVALRQAYHTCPTPSVRAEIKATMERLGITPPE